MAADPLDILTLEEAKQAINMSGYNDDRTLVLERHITAVSRCIDDACGPVVQRDIADEVIPGGHPTIMLMHSPVTSVTTVEEDQFGSVVTVAALDFGETGDGYRASSSRWEPGLLSGELVREYQCWYPQVRVTYVAGRYDDTASVDQRFKDAAAAILRRLWKREAGTWAQSSSVFEAADDQITSGFFRVAKPIIDEMLWAYRRTSGFA